MLLANFKKPIADGGEEEILVNLDQVTYMEMGKALGRDTTVIYFSTSADGNRMHMVHVLKSLSEIETMLTLAGCKKT